jgi:hypothetical protein
MSPFCRLVLLGLLTWGSQQVPAYPQQKLPPLRTDVVVYGGNAGGVIAAVAAAREGKSAVIIEPGKHVGGMVSGGLGATDTGNRGAIGGYAREFFSRVRAYYEKKYGAKSQQVKDSSDGFHFEPHVAEQVFRDMLTEARIDVVHGQRVQAVAVKNARIEHITLTNGQTVQGSVFIDASYEGDVMAKAKVKYAIGREGRDQYNESIAGVQKFSPAHQWPVKVDPFIGKKLLPLVQSEPPGAPGSGDKKTQAYNFRMCMTQVKDDMFPFPRPANYQSGRYALLARYLKERPNVTIRQLMNPVKMPNGTTDTNNNGPFSTDHIGANWDYPEADYATRDKIWQDHIEYQQGFMFFLANDVRVPAGLRKEMNTWGLSRHEFKDTGHWPHQLYVREARRMSGEYVMAQADIMDKRSKEDSVGLGSYNTDSHHVQRVVGPDGFVLNEGDFQVRVQPYAIAYRSLVPKAADCSNLLVPVCMSASHVAYGTIRMEPVYMILGQACGVAAAQAVDDKVGVQKISITKLQEKLKAQKAVLSPEGLSKPLPASIDIKKLSGVVVDDTAAQKTGHWVHSASAGPFVGDGYLHDGNQDQGKSRVRFTPKLAKAGKYEVRVFYSPNPNRATNALVVVHARDGVKEVRVNQRQAIKNGPGLRLGEFTFAEGDRGHVEVRNDGADGFVIADAVQWIAIE